MVQTFQSTSFVLLVCLMARHTVQATNEKPVFVTSDRIIKANENTAIGSSVGVIVATDHENDPIVFSLDATGAEVLNIDNTGNLTLIKELDREDKTEYVFDVTAADQCPGCDLALRKTTRLFILVVEDANDNKPEFISTLYLARVTENDTIGHLVIQVSAIDRDEGANAEVSYMFSPSTQHTDTFEINNHNGEIKLKGPLDFEKFQRYTLFVDAQDGGTPPLESQTTVIVDVSDVSDRPPLFVKSTYLKEIPENLAKGSVILQVQAVDGDAGVSNDVKYAIIQGNDEGLFAIDSLSGNMTINGTIDAEKTDFYRITVKASEIVDPSSTSTAVVLISVMDVNDNSPQFTQDSYQFQIRENRAKSGYIVSDQFIVRDADIYPQNRRFEYSLSGEDSKYFAITPSSGILTVNASLDYEERHNFSFKIFANETETAERLSDFALVTVTVIVNDINITDAERCEEDCVNDGKECRQFGAEHLCLCLLGKTGDKCNDDETTRKTVNSNMEITNEVWREEYNNLENGVTQAFTGRFENTVSHAFKDTDVIKVKVTKLRPGSVIAEYQATFNNTEHGKGEVDALLQHVAKDGNLGPYKVINIGSAPPSPTSTNPTATDKPLTDIIYGTLIGILALIIVILMVYMTIKHRRRQRKNRPYEIPAKESHTNEVAIDAVEMSDRAVADHSAGSPYMELNEANRSQETSAYAPLHPGTRSWEVARENVIIEKVIGKGAFGQVAQGKASQLRGMKEETIVAVKMLKENAPETDRKDLLSELELLKTLKPHPHVIKLLGCVTETDPLLVIIEYVPYGDLLGYLRNSRGLKDMYFKDPDIKPQTNLTPQQLMKFSWQIADGMQYLSSRSIIHRDLAARNVLIGERETCKVTDFGMARDVHQQNTYERKSKGRLPVKWTAYEALLFGRYSTKSDVWSYGVVLYEIFTIGGSPYPRTEGRQIADILQQGYRMLKPRHVDDALYKIMLKCWELDPDDRPTFLSLRDELKELENQHKRLINMNEYDNELYENVEDLNI